MVFSYHINSGDNRIIINGDEYRHLFKARRHKINEIIPFRNLKDGYLYFYIVKSVNRKEAILELVKSEFNENRPKKEFHLGWCIIDFKTILKTIPTLNEIGVTKISFIYCDRSQRNFKIDLEKLQRVLILSCMQNGRSNLMEIEILNSINDFRKYGEFTAIHFSKDNYLGDSKRVLIGAEGGFTENELNSFKDIKGLDSFILKSETAVIVVSTLTILRS